MLFFQYEAKEYHESLEILDCLESRTKTPDKTTCSSTKTENRNTLGDIPVTNVSW